MSNVYVNVNLKCNLDLKKNFLKLSSNFFLAVLGTSVHRKIWIVHNQNGRTTSSDHKSTGFLRTGRKNILIILSLFNYTILIILREYKAH